MTSSSGSLKLEIHTEDKTLGKWSVPLSEEVFWRFLSGAGGSEKAVFSEGSIFSPFLFGKYFDPSDAFPLWEFEADVLLASLRSVGQCRVDWSQADQTYALISDLPVVGKNNVQVYVDVKGKMMEISGQWNINKKTAASGDWRSGRWWEYGYVRRLELPGDADPQNSEAFLSNKDDYSLLEIIIPKINSKNKF
ncbi:hypothetical protein BRARA_J00934 [Brassica rapa]|uniref:SHSP domain-containing protein n=4 Tax=Brassica TaxID=3705 RepID=A0ABQ8BP08_BRANA|nr:21.7 kDa class VI heat shock protein [Brassica rapa]XP_048598789.1 21.7 kDa class VI heat shock protein [Brassica napus]KAG5374932.1 hypothetical protein IGI04_039528 [Brassica rapa subsp. trilocularis]KAH0906468.1 hypothetical protein HID58_038295 [Brassica napus]RID40931.1 hypothetical protein BRARA_J00934 [Brassica rapa]CDY42474.1 BnaA10g08500D [Brassica napus]VDD17578.1 unnamed protein product [Brassica rapa]